MGTAPQPAPTGFKPDPDIINEFQRLMNDQYETQKRAIADAVANARTEISAEFKTELDKRAADLTTLVNDKVTAVAQKTSRPPVGIGADGGEYRSFGQQIVESDVFKSYQSQPSGRPKFSVTLKGRAVPSLEKRAINPFISDATNGVPYIPKRIGVFTTQPLWPLVMRDLMDVIPLDGTNAIEYVQETYTLNADYQVNPGDKKAQSDITYEEKTANVRTIAHFVKVARQTLADAPFVQASIDNRMTYGIALKEDKEILYGDGAPGHIQGIMPIASAYNADFLTPAGGTSPVLNDIDQIYSACMQLMQLGYAPSAVVLNPIAWARMTLTKTGLGLYLLGGPPMTEPNPRIWGLPLALSKNMAAADFLIGQFPGNAALFDREQVVVEVSTENEDDFVRNLVTIRAEERITTAWFLPQAFVKGTLMVPAP